MANGIWTGDPRGFNKGCSSKFREGSRVRQKPEEGRRTYRPKRCENNNKDEDNSPKPLLIKINKLCLRNLDNFNGFFDRIVLIPFSTNHFLVSCLCWGAKATTSSSPHSCNVHFSDIFMYALSLIFLFFQRNFNFIEESVASTFLFPYLTFFVHLF